MKKTLASLILVSFLAVLAVPMVASAQVPTGCNITASTLERIKAADKSDKLDTCISACEYSIEECGMCCLVNTLYNATDWIFFALIAVAGILVILGAMNMIMSQGDPERVSTGRNYVVYAAIGLAIGLLARAIPNIAMTIVG